VRLAAVGVAFTLDLLLRPHKRRIQLPDPQLVALVPVDPLHAEGQAEPTARFAPVDVIAGESRGDEI
jgi:hypothetical protein